MCKGEFKVADNTSKKKAAQKVNNSDSASSTKDDAVLIEKNISSMEKKVRQGRHQGRRQKRDKDGVFVPCSTKKQEVIFQKKKSKKKSKSLEKHGKDAPSGGIEALIPSLIGVALLVCVVMAKMGFRGRATVAGIDLGTTNSVICVQAPSKSVGEIECIPDPSTQSPIIPSVVSFLELSERQKMRSTTAATRKIEQQDKGSALNPPPSHVIVGTQAKHRINTHPHHTLYNAKRVLGRSHDHVAVNDLKQEVEFNILGPDECSQSEHNEETQQQQDEGVVFRVSHHTDDSTSDDHTSITLKPQQVGSYIVNYLMDITKQHLGHENVKSSVIAVPAKFDALQRQRTVEAFKAAGVTVARILEEPQAAALAYGLHKKPGVDYILVYDFGGGTLDVSVLYVTDGFVDVMGSDGDDQLGGADFDAAVAHVLLDQRGEEVAKIAKALQSLETELLKETDGSADFEEILSATCPLLGESTPLCTVSSFHTIGEKMKIKLSAHPEGGAVVDAACMTLPAEGNFETLTIAEFCDALVEVPLRITSDEYDTAAKELFNRSMVPIQQILKDLSLGKDEIDEVVMVGGTTRMPQIRKLVQEELEVESLNTHIDPDLTVAYGAASVID
mmetsp:Transcript_26904/g.41204  ORF Transcript_26904/g.41204 Transcript_26904/m.41204 type:complete len:615 (+) Transcript_26904:140-1984(+)